MLPAGAEIKDTSPVKLFVTRGACEGSAALRLLGQRTPLTIRAYRGGLAAPRLLATSAAIAAPDANAPTGIHLSLRGATEMAVTWTTHNQTAPCAYYGQPAGPSRVAGGVSSTLRRGDLPGEARVSWTPSRPMELSSNASGIGWLDPGTQHTATMTGAAAAVSRGCSSE